MATMTGLIDEVIAQVIHLPSSDSENTARRARVLFLAKQIVNERWHKPYRFTRKVADVTALAVDGGANALPADFMELGQEGSVMRAADPDYPLVEVSYQEMVSAIEAGVPTSILERFTIGSVGDSVSKLLTDPPSSNTALIVNYKRTPPVLTDAAPGGLELLPLAYHYDVLFNGIVCRILRDRNDDPRLEGFEADYERGIIAMEKTERIGKTQIGRVPAFGITRMGMY